MNKIKQKREDWFPWLQFSRSYLLLAKLGCQELLEPKRNRNEKVGDKAFFKMNYFRHDLFIAILYNAKHGIEIFIKTLNFILSGKLEKRHLTHDISHLFKVLEKEIRSHKNKINSVITEKLKKNDLSDHDKINLREAKKDLSNLLIFLEKIKELVSKYYHCDVIKEKIENDFIIEDIDNTTFRYPENNLKIKLNYKKLLLRITKDDIKVIFKDVIDLLENFNSLGFILDIYKQHC